MAECTVELPDVPYFSGELDTSDTTKCTNADKSWNVMGQKLTLAGFTRIQQTSSGGSHATMVARCQTTKELVHIRVYALEHLRRDAALRDRIERCVLVGRKAQHSCIVRVMGPLFSKTDLFVVEEHCAGGELLSWVETHCREVTSGRGGPGRSLGLEVDFVKGVMRDVMSGVDYLHTKCGVAHRSIKLENVLLDGRNHAKLGNLGTCAAISSKCGVGPKSGLLQVCCASRHYAAPEVVMGLPYDGRLVDVWAAGVLLFVLLTCRFPFEGENGNVCVSGDGRAVCNSKGDELLLENICNADEVLLSHPLLMQVSDPLATDLVRNMLRVNTKTRLTVREVLEHPFLRMP